MGSVSSYQRPQRVPTTPTTVGGCGGMKAIHEESGPRWMLGLSAP